MSSIDIRNDYVNYGKSERMLLNEDATTSELLNAIIEHAQSGDSGDDPCSDCSWIVKLAEQALIQVKP